MRTMLGLLLILTAPALAHAGRARYCRQTCGLAISHCVQSTHQSQKACRRQELRQCKRGRECVVNCAGNFTCSNVYPVCGQNWCCPANSTACGSGCCSDPAYPVCGDDGNCYPPPPPITIDS